MPAIRRIQKTIINCCSLLGLALLLGMAATACAQEMDQGYAPPPQGSQDLSVDAGAADASASVDPPSRVARLSLAQGNVSVEPASVDEFSPAELNYPLTTGDRVWADNGAQAELEAGQLAVRLGSATDLTVTAMTDTLAQFGLGQGSVHLRTYALDPQTTTELDTPNVAITVMQAGDVRVDVDPNSATTIVTLISGEVEVGGNGLEQTLEPGQRVQFDGTNPVTAQGMQAAGGDGLDAFSSERDQAYEGAESTEQGYLNADTVGGADLTQYGDWAPDADYGAVWYPSGVAANWQPYCYGHWTWVAPWGWTWVENEAWGFAPFHYGRWAQLGGRWGWIPGPPVLHPVYSPGLVVFVNAGTGVSAWFPLGPKEPYAPWYHASTLYLNRVNASNFASRDASQARKNYATANREVYANASGGRFANRSLATVAVSQASFAAGHPVARERMNLSAAQLAGAPVLAHPAVTPERSMVSPSAARSVPPHSSRPTLAMRQGSAGRVGTGGGHPAQAGTGNGAGAGSRAPVGRRGFTPGQPAASAPPASRPATPSNPSALPERGQPENQPGAIQGGVRTPSPVRGTEQLPPANDGAQGQPRQLYNRAAPPPPRPSFDQQREEMQSTEPGRPLSPQQLNTLRDNNRPANQPQPREAAPREAPPSAPRSSPAPAPRNNPPPAPRSEDRR